MTRSDEANHGVVVENQWYDDWIETNVPDLTGKVAIITGSNSGTGFWTANALAKKGCTVILACRNAQKAEAAKTEILERFPSAKIDVIGVLDNMDLSTVRSFAETFNKKYDRLDLLLNNAGIMAQPKIESKDGYDIQFQTNHLSHFLLTKLLWTKLVETPGESRVVQHSSSAHDLGSPRFDSFKVNDPTYDWGFLGINSLLWNVMLPIMGLKPVDNWMRYGSSKLCNVLFAKELARKIEASSTTSSVLSLACHPGYANTNLQNAAKDSMNNWEKMNSGNAQSAADGSLPLLMAAVGTDIKQGDYTGPEKTMKGPPIVTPVKGNGDNKAMAEDLWTFSEKCIKESFDVV
mmetsp:Transcript_57155/g.139329  ORF Transcript_57155/g.139329 Transcript_57155/m.139329 type:complete len:348 (+) Transcript_57155:536-1579(+)